MESADPLMSMYHQIQDPLDLTKRPDLLNKHQANIMRYA